MILYTYQVTYQEMVEDEAKDIRNVPLGPIYTN